MLDKRIDRATDEKEVSYFTLCAQEELFKILRSLLKTTDNQSLEQMTQKSRVQVLVNCIKPLTWKTACETHFVTVPEGLGATKEAYLQQYAKNRFGA